MNEGLLNALSANPSINVVYFNSKGEWLFVPNKLHPIERTREEVLNGINPDPADEFQNNFEQSSPGRPGRKKKIITDVSE